MKQSEIKELPVEEIQEKIVKFKEKYTSFKLLHAVSPLENPLEIRKVRKTIARLATELRKRELQ